MTIEELKIKLIKLGWSFEEGRGTGVAWQAYKRFPNFNSCLLNDRPPAVILVPYEFPLDGRRFESIEFQITGQTQSGEWVNFKVYSVNIDEAIDKIPLAVDLLRAAWNATCFGITEITR